MEKRKRRRNPLLTFLIVLLCIMLLVLAAAFIIFRHYYNKSIFVDDDTITLDPNADYEAIEDSIQEAMENEAKANGENGDAIATLSPEEEEEIRKNAPTVVDLTEGDIAGTYNLLLIGVDRRDRSWNGNSDAMVLVTINQNVNKIFMTSFMRDLYAAIPNVGVRKLNHAYAIGAGPLLVDTIKRNYGVAIDNYAHVDFEDMKTIIDIFGGVDITIKDYEVTPMAAYGITGPGTYHLDGKAALAYSRIRYYGNSDFERTSRQRAVLTAMMTRAKSMSLTEISGMADQILPIVSHNIPATQVMKLIASMPGILQYDVQQLRVPFDNSWHSVNEILIPNNMNDTINQIRGTIYAR